MFRITRKREQIPIERNEEKKKKKSQDEISRNTDISRTVQFIALSLLIGALFYAWFFGGESPVGGVTTTPAPEVPTPDGRTVQKVPTVIRGKTIEELIEELFAKQEGK